MRWKAEGLLRSIEKSQPVGADIIHPLRNAALYSGG